MFYADGSLRQISPSIDPSVWAAMSTIRGREELPAEYDRSRR
jgi:hypothetical protein